MEYVVSMKFKDYPSEVTHKYMFLLARHLPLSETYWASLAEMALTVVKRHEAELGEHAGKMQDKDVQELAYYLAEITYIGG